MRCLEGRSAQLRLRTMHWSARATNAVIFVKGVDLLKDMNLQRLRSDVITFNALISSCSRLSRVDSALSLFRKMRAASIQPTSVTCSTLINSCESGKRFATALRLFEDFQQTHVEGNLISYNAVISACGNGGLQKRALKVFEEMSDNQIEADACTYNSLIAASCKVLALQEAWDFENEMCVTGVTDMVTYIPFLRTEDSLKCNSSYVCDALEAEQHSFCSTITQALSQDSLSSSQSCADVCLFVCLFVCVCSYCHLHT